MAVVVAGEGGTVGRDDHVVHLPQRRVLGERFGLEDVEGTACDRAGPERLDQRRLVDDAAAGDVDEIRVLAHGGEFVGADQALCRSAGRRGRRSVVSDCFAEVLGRVDITNARFRER